MTIWSPSQLLPILRLPKTISCLFLSFSFPACFIPLPLSSLPLPHVAWCTSPPPSVLSTQLARIGFPSSWSDLLTNYRESFTVERKWYSLYIYIHLFIYSMYGYMYSMYGYIYSSSVYGDSDVEQNVIMLQVEGVLQFCVPLYNFISGQVCSQNRTFPCVCPQQQGSCRISVCTANKRKTENGLACLILIDYRRF